MVQPSTWIATSCSLVIHQHPRFGGRRCARCFITTLVHPKRLGFANWTARIDSYNNKEPR